MIKGLRRHDSLLITILTVLFFLEILFIAGQLGGFLDADGNWDFEIYKWEMATTVHTILFWCTWLAAIASVVLSGETIEFKIGAAVFFSLFAFVSLRTLYQALVLSGLL